MKTVSHNKKQKPNYIQPSTPSNSFDGDTWFDTQNNLLKVYGSSEQFTIYNFQNSNEGFSTLHCSITTNTNSITVTTTASDPQIIKTLAFYGGQYPIVRVKIKSPGTNSWQGTLYYTTGSHSYSNSYCKTISSDPTGEGYVIIEFDMSSLTAGGNDWITNEITAIRFDFGDNQIGEKFEIDYISIRNTNKWREFNSLSAAGQNYAYICGGYTGSINVSNIERMTFPFNSGTAEKISNLLSKTTEAAGFNSSTHGYICGNGAGSVYTSTIQRFEFPFNSGVTTHQSNLTVSKEADSGGCNNSQYGYITSLSEGGANSLSNIERLTFSFDSNTASHVGNLTGTIANLSSCNSSQHGFFFGGGVTGSATISNIERIVFPFDSGTASHVGNLNTNNKNSCSCNSSIYGFIFGGYTSSGISSSLQRITFPFNSGTANALSVTTTPRHILSACNSTNYGFFCGGEESGGAVSTIERLDFTYQGTKIHVGNLSRAMKSQTAIDGIDFVNLFT